MLFQEDKNVLVIATKQDVAKNLVTKVRVMHDNLPSWLKGKTLEEAKQIKDKEIAAALELPPIKLHCSVLAEETIQTAIKDWEKKSAHRKHNQRWEDPNGYGY